jgi:hypothetical protein
MESGKVEHDKLELFKKAYEEKVYLSYINR